MGVLSSVMCESLFLLSLVLMYFSCPSLWPWDRPAQFYAVA